jgi:nitroreductase/NAD-dependent dihydropyrimidine dehydrogenase PreA subunit
MDKVMVDPERCTMCGLCIQVCPLDIFVEGSKIAQTIKPESCYYCGHCKALCPEDALHFPVLPEEDFKPVLGAAERPNPERLLLQFRSRRTTRHFRPGAVEREKLEKIIQAGRYAPTGHNNQAVQYLVVQTPQALSELKEQALKALAGLVKEFEKRTETARGKQGSSPKPAAFGRYAPASPSGIRKKVEAAQRGKDLLFYNAPVLMICHTDPSKTSFPEWDVSLATMQMLLMAEALGLGTCLNGSLVYAIEYSAELRSALPIPAEHEIPVCFMVGYPALNFLRTVYRQRVPVTWL